MDGYTFDQIFAADPVKKGYVAANASVLIFAPGDESRTPLALRAVDGLPMANPVQTNEDGFGGVFIADIERVAWAGGEFTGFFTSYESMRDETQLGRVASQEAAASSATSAGEASAARLAAEAAAGMAADAAAAEVQEQLGATVAEATAAREAAELAASLVEAPADDVTAGLVGNPETLTGRALSAAFAFGETIDGRKFGLAGDGATINNTALANAVQESAAKGMPLYLAPGSYKLSTTIVVPAGASIIGPSSARIFGDLPSAALLAVGGNHTRLHGFSLENTATNIGNILVSIRPNTTGLRITEVKFKGGDRTQAISISLNGIRDIRIAGCVFDSLNYGVLSDTAGGTGMDLYNVKIVENTFTNIYGDGIEINSPITGMGLTGRTPIVDAQHGIIIADNYIKANLGSNLNSGFGIGVAGAWAVTITGNILEDSRREAIHAEDYCESVSITGNIIRRGAIGIAGLSHSKQIMVQGNDITGCTGVGILMVSSAGEMTTRTNITGNIVSGCGGNGIEVNGTSTANVQIETLIANNQVYGCAGDGFVVYPGNGGLVTVAHNQASGNAGYGYTFRRGLGLLLAGNAGKNNVAGKFRQSAIVPVTIQNPQGSATVSASASADTPWASLMPLGKMCSGRISITAWESANVNYSTILYDLKWTGSALTVTEVTKASSGSIGATIGVQATLGNLEAKVFWAGEPVTVHFDANLDGVLVL